MPPIVMAIFGAIQLGVKAAPVAVEFYKSLRDLIARLFAGGLITIEQQAALFSWAEAHEAATLAGEIPPALQVEADPT